MTRHSHIPLEVAGMTMALEVDQPVFCALVILQFSPLRSLEPEVYEFHV